MADKAEFLQAINEAILDADSLERFINGSDSETVLTRLSKRYPTLQKAIKELFEKGGLPATPFKTKGLMDSSGLDDGKYALITDDDANNGLYVKEGGAWVKSSYDPVGVASKITSRMLGQLENSLVDVSSNLYNPQEALLNKYANPSTGEITDSTSNLHITGKIPVSIGEYTISAVSSMAESFRNVVFYDYNDNFVKGSVFSSGSNPLTINVSDENIAYMILSMRHGMPEDYERMINKGSEALPYEPYYIAFKDVDLSDSQIEQVVESIDITDSAKPFLKNSDSYNLFNYKKVTEGLFVGLDGEEVPNVLYFTTDYIPIKPSTSYSISNDIGVNGFNLTLYYDENKVFIKGITSTTSVSGFYSWKSPANAHFVRLCSNWKDPSRYNRMFIEGTLPLPYKSGVPVLEDIKLGDNVLAEIGGIAPPSSKLTYIYDRDLNEVFSLSAGFTGYTDWGTRTAAQVYALYDDLVAAHSTYITKYELSPDGLGNPIAYYHFKPAKPTTHTDTQIPKVVIITGQHGHEKAAPLSVYLFAKQLCEGWRDDKIIEAMRFGAEFYILPLGNPSGWANGERKNHNQVDLNRNFPWNWSNTEPVTSSKYGGPSAASEIETQNAVQMLSEIGRIDIAYDHHNFQRSEDRYLWLSIGDASNKLIQRMAQSFISRMTNNWRKEYDWVTQDESWFAGYYTSTSNPGGGYLGNYMRNVHNVEFGGTFEVCDNWTLNRTLTPYGVELTKTGVEALVNWLAINLYYLNETL